MAAHITEEGWLINGQDCGFTGNLSSRTEHIRSYFVSTAMRFQNADVNTRTRIHPSLLFYSTVEDISFDPFLNIKVYSQRS